MKTQTIPHRTALVKTPREKREARESYMISVGNGGGLLLSGFLMAFFLVMRAFGLHEILAFRFLNFIFIAGAVLLAFMMYRRKYGYEGIRYLAGIKMGIHVTLLGTLLFALFMGIYLSADNGFMNYIQDNGEFGKFLTPVRAAGGLFMEMFATGAILTFSFMQLFKDEKFNPNLEK